MAASKSPPTPSAPTSFALSLAAAWPPPTSSTTARWALPSTAAADSPELLRNEGANANHWLEVLLIGTKSNRDGNGSVLKLTAEGFVQTDQARGGTSYMSASDPRLHFGLGKRTKIDSLIITWPGGQVDKLTNVPIDSIIAVKEGAGIVPHPFPRVKPR